MAGVNERSTEYARELVAVSPKRLNDRATGTSKHTPEVARSDANSWVRLAEPGLVEPQIGEPERLGMRHTDERAGALEQLAFGAKQPLGPWRIESARRSRRHPDAFGRRLGCGRKARQHRLQAGATLHGRPCTTVGVQMPLKRETIVSAYPRRPTP